MSPGATFERVYAALKERLTGGGLVPGDPLEPATLGYELNSSVTPVRDALHRLVGERLVEAARTEGFRVPRIGEKALRELYGWNSQLLILSARLAAFHEEREATIAAAAAVMAGGPLVERTETLFLALARSSRNTELVVAVTSVSERVRTCRIAETSLLRDAGEELDHLDGTLRGGDVPAIRRALTAYHRRRERIVPELLARLAGEA